MWSALEIKRARHRTSEGRTPLPPPFFPPAMYSLAVSHPLSRSISPAIPLCQLYAYVEGPHAGLRSLEATAAIPPWRCFVAGVAILCFHPHTSLFSHPRRLPQDPCQRLQGSL